MDSSHCCIGSELSEGMYTNLKVRFLGIVFLVKEMQENYWLDAVYMLN
jgi:hypothetical protein